MDGGTRPAAAGTERWAALRETGRGALVAHLSDEDLDTLSRCAVAGVFDEPTFSALLYRGGRTLEQLRRLLLVVDDDAVPGRMKPAALFDGPDGLFWTLWTQQRALPESVVELSARLAERYLGGSETAPHALERLKHLMVADRSGESVRREFAELFRARDAAFDLPGCWDVLAVLDDPARSVQLSPELLDLSARYRLRTSVRAAHHDDYLLTDERVYLERPEPQRALNLLLEEGAEGTWMVRLQGVGGAGKTTLLRWFAARRCIDAEDPDGRAPALCAWLDGAVARTVELLQHPWLVLVEAAAQLYRTTGAGGLEDFVATFGDYRGLLGAGVFGLEAPPSPKREIEPAAVARGFADAVAGLGTIVLLLDNLDDLYVWGLLGERRLEGFFDFLGMVHSECGQVRVVVSGRQDFVQAVDRLAEIGPPTVPVGEFTARETADLLRLKGVDDQQTIDAIVERSRGLPILVAGLATLMRRGLLTPAMIRAADAPMIAYLAKRIIEPVTNPVVRWILCYACVPNVFRRAFVEEVMLPVLRAFPDDGGAVRTEFDLDRSLEQPRVEKWHVPAADDESGLDALWAKVRLQLPGLLWFSSPGRDEGTFTIQTDLRWSLRDKVAGHEAVRRIHERAARHFTELAESAALAVGAFDRDYWLDATLQAVFHAVCADLAQGRRRWRQAVDEARRQGRLDWAEKVTEYVLVEFSLVPAAESDLPEAVDHAARPRLSGADVYEVALERARISAQQAGLLPGGPRPSATAQWLPECALRLDEAVAARRQAAAAGEPIDPAGEGEGYASILTMLALLGGGAQNRAQIFSEDQALLRPSLGPSPGPRPGTPGAEARDQWLLRARQMRAPETRIEAERAYAAAFDAARRAGDGAAWIAAEAASWHLRVDRVRDAELWCERAEALPDDPYAPDRAAREDLRGMRLSILLERGRPTAVLNLAADLADAPAVAPAVTLMAARAHLALCRPLLSLAELSADGPPRREQDEAVFEIELERARVHGALLDLHAAHTALRRAEELVQPGDVARRVRVVAAWAKLDLERAGDLRAAAFKLNAQTEDPPEGTEERFELDLARAELARHTLDLEGLQAHLEVLEQTAYGPSGTRPRRIKALCSRLAAGSRLPTRQQAGALERLLDELEAESSAESGTQGPRLRLLASLARCPAPNLAAEQGERLRERLYRLLPPPSVDLSRDTNDEDLPRDDLGYRYSVLAELYRVFGDASSAMACRERAVFILGEVDPFIEWLTLDAVSRVGAEHMLRQPDPRLFEARYGRHSALTAAMLCQWVTIYDRKLTSSFSTLMLTLARRLEDQADPVPTLYRMRNFECFAARPGIDPAEAEETKALAERVREQLGRSTAPEHRGEGRLAPLMLIERPNGVQVAVPGPPLAAVDHPFPFTEAAGAFTESLTAWSARAGTDLSEDISSRLSEIGGGRAVIGLFGSSTRFAGQPWELLPVDGVPLGRHRLTEHILRCHASANPQERRDALVRHLLGRQQPELAVAAGQAPPTEPDDAQRKLDELADRFRQLARTRPRPLRVHLLLPAIGGSVGTLAAFHRRMQQTEDAYRASGDRALDPRGPGVEVTRSQGLDALELAAAAENGRRFDAADIVHVCGVVRVERDLPVLGNGDGDQPADARTINSAIRGLTGAIAPLVVLDFIAPANPTSLRRHLVLRNRFAHQLLSLGDVDTILAAGLETEQSARQLDTLAEEFRRGGNAATACRAIRNLASASASQISDTAAVVKGLPYLSAAVFSSLPADALYEPGLFNRD